jgi:hypothetical protein
LGPFGGRNSGTGDVFGGWFGLILCRNTKDQRCPPVWTHPLPLLIAVLGLGSGCRFGDPYVAHTVEVGFWQARCAAKTKSYCNPTGPKASTKTIPPTRTRTTKAQDTPEVWAHSGGGTPERGMFLEVGLGQFCAGIQRIRDAQQCGPPPSGF